MDTPWTCIHVTQSRECGQLPTPHGELVKACEWLRNLHVKPIVPEDTHLVSSLHLKERGEISENVTASTDNEVFT